WRFDGIHFAMRDSSKRPAMAFLLFTRPDGRVAEEESRRVEDVEHVSTDPWRRLRELAGVQAEDDEPADPTSEEPLSADPDSRMSSNAPGLRVISGAREGSPYPKCSLLLRGMARLTDIAIALVLWRVAAGAGMVVALLYLLLADGLLQGQSPGKRIF